jgi:hypothetical protein
VDIRLRLHGPRELCQNVPVGHPIIDDDDYRHPIVPFLPQVSEQVSFPYGLFDGGEHNSSRHRFRDLAVCVLLPWRL